MALFGNIDRIAEVLSADPRFASAFAYIRRCFAPESPEASRIRGLTAGEVEEIALDQGAVAFEQVYETRGRADCFFESHRKYIDVQCIVEGEEAIDVIAIAELEITKPYREEKDVVKYADCGLGSRLRLHAGQAAVFFPEDGHMPGQIADASRLVRKTVVKVPVAGPGNPPA